MEQVFNVGAKRRRFGMAGLGAASIFAQPDGPGRKGARPGPPKNDCAPRAAVALWVRASGLRGTERKPCAGMDF